jgi:hypothetical protein
VGGKPVPAWFIKEMFQKHSRKPILNRSSGLDTIETLFPDATSMTMLKSYRSTYEIIQFTKKIRKNIEIEAIERHGEKPAVFAFKKEADEPSGKRPGVRQCNSAVCYQKKLFY